MDILIILMVKELNEWDPTIYANLEENLFRRRILEYQEYLALRTPWFATRYKGDILNQVRFLLMVV